jgi:hypothetical protein
MVTVRFKPDEHQQLVDAAASTGLSYSDLIRQTAACIVIEARPPKIHADTLAELGRWGNNLNQLAKIANKTGQIELELLKEISAACRQIADRVAK